MNKKAKLRDFYGIMSKETANVIEKDIIESRKLHRDLHEKRIKRLIKIWEN